ncbi:NAD(P)-binding protein [Tothia fuscella]|uniref:NAD(P)-binding protein n=1 Tax=Tothia fuscella TaxID=1048955 RepID=A0A9P4P1S9_9PEZI|nr:NAD(P)-binding protein [Tothia fuscella]
MAYPAHYGSNFCPTTHSKAEGLTDPANNKLPANFVVVVTGAGKGLGYHIALAYAKAGASGISISSRTKKDLDDLSSQLHQINPNLEILAQTCDTTKDEEVQQLASGVQARFGRVDAVIANAGIISKYLQDEDGSNRRLPVGAVEDDDFDRVILINLIGSQKVAKYFIPLLEATRDGPQAYVVITSMASQLPHSQFTTMAYNLSKIAVNRMAEHIHNDHNEKDGIQAFAVHPGAVLTPQTELHSTEKGDAWEQVLTDDVGLSGGWLTWLTKERRDWLSGRYLSVNWDVSELEDQKEEIVAKDKLKFIMVV